MLFSQKMSPKTEDRSHVTGFQHDHTVLGESEVEIHSNYNYKEPRS